MVSETSPGVAQSQINLGDQTLPSDLGISKPVEALAQGQQQVVDGEFDAQQIAEQADAAGGSRDPALPASEQTPALEILRTEVESAAYTIIKAEAVQAYRRGLKGDLENPSERALGRLGRYLALPTVSTPHTGEPLMRTVVAGEYRGGVLEKNHPLPRLQQSTEPGQWVTAFDARATDDDQEPSGMGAGVVQLDTFTGRTPDGAYHFLGTDMTGAHGSEIVLTENDFVKAFMLAQTAELQKGLDPDAAQPSATSGLRKQSERAVFGKTFGTCGDFVASYDGSEKDGFDLVGDVDENSVKEALKEGNVTISREAGLSLANSMIEYNKKNLAGLPVKQIATIESALQKNQVEIEAGIQPSAEQLYRILVLVGEPGLRNRLDIVNGDVRAIEQKLSSPLTKEEESRLKGELKKKQGEQTSLRSVLEKKTDNEVFRLLEDAQNGKMDPDLVGLLNDKIAQITDPQGFFEFESKDLNDKNSLASIIVKHFAVQQGIDDVKMEAWISKFFRENGSNIAMMGIFALFQMLSGTLQAGIKNV